MATIKYPVYQPQLHGNEKKYVNECLDSSWISSKGKFVSAFEEGFSKYTGITHSAAVCNGTVALHLALLAVGIGEGDEVIVPTLTYIASVNAITYTNATPVFADSLEVTWQLDPLDVEKKITSKTKAIMAVHVYGHPCDMKAFRDLCDKYNLYLIEDCAEALGSFHDGMHVGTLGDVATFSFYGNKTITTGEGGMVATNNQSIYNKTVHLKGQGLAADREYWHDAIGYNYRMTNICAAIGYAQLENIETVLKKKGQIAQWYDTFLNKNKYQLQIELPNVIHSYWMCTILIQENIDRSKLKAYLIEKGIETRPMFYPIHTMPIYSQYTGIFPVAERLAAKGMNLPSYPELKMEDVQYISDCLNSYES